MGLRVGRYETTQRLASGGMATVYLGRAVGEGGFERLVAIKIMHEHVAADAEFCAMFLDEARLAARIHHPNVVGVIDIQRSLEGKLFLVMDYVDGASVFQLRKVMTAQGKPLPLDVALRIFLDALAGLHAAHELTGPDGTSLLLVHRDVSPQNILVGRDGVTRITDFGVARAEERIASTRDGQLKGKIAYMPAEQITNELLDRRADVYAAAASLWEALTNQRLFDATNDAALVHQIVAGVTRSPSDVNPAVPPAISRVCMQALSLNRAARPDSAAAFADALEAAAREAGVEVGSTKRVAAFLASLPPGSIGPGSEISSPGRSAPGRASTIETSSPTSRDDATRAEHPAPSVREGSTTHSLVTGSDRITLPKRSNKPLVVGAAIVAALAGVGVWRLTYVPARDATIALASSEPTRATSAPSERFSAESAPLVVTPAAAASTAASSAASAVASASSTASATPVASAPQPSGFGSAGRIPPGVPKGRVGVGYDPNEL